MPRPHPHMTGLSQYLHHAGSCKVSDCWEHRIASQNAAMCASSSSSAAFCMSTDPSLTVLPESAQMNPYSRAVHHSKALIITRLNSLSDEPKA